MQWFVFVLSIFTIGVKALECFVKCIRFFLACNDYSQLVHLIKQINLSIKTACHSAVFAILSKHLLHMYAVCITLTGTVAIIKALKSCMSLSEHHKDIMKD